MNANDPAQTYGIHGTNNEATIPGHVSKGCIRLKNADIKELYVDFKVPIGTPVWIHSGESNHQWLNKNTKEEVKSISGQIITTAKVNIRQGLSTSTALLGQVDANTKLTVTGESKNWYRVKLSNGKIGFIAKLYAKLDTNNSTSQQNQQKTDLSISTKASFTNDGSLKIDASLPNAKKASGTWKVSVNGNTLVNEEKEGTSFTTVQKQPDLEGKQLQINVEFSGTVDGQKRSGSKQHTYNKVTETLSITPSFKDNQLRIQASLKGNQKAVGIWKIQLGETERVILQSGEKLDETFDEVTFDKKHVPVKVEFKGFIQTSLVTATYEKNLQVQLPNLNNGNLDPTGNQLDVTPVADETNEEETNEEETSENEGEDEGDITQDETDTSEDSDEEGEESEDTDKEVNYNGEQPTYQSVAMQENDGDGSEEEEVAKNDQNTNNQQGGQLPKTDSNYPLGFWTGLGIFIIGLGCILLPRMRREQ